MTPVFKIGGVDLTAYVDIQNYAVNKADVYQEWTDGDWIYHRDIARTRISGTVPVGFSTAQSRESFQALIAAQKTAAGYYPVTLYVNNTDTVESVNAFLDMTAAGKWDIVNGRLWLVQTVKVTER